uniref:Uncharacterized protein n=1 Tax=Chenopodium quinoa TaxID=63459 RepID=A0A803NDI1_CHEQI
MEPTTTIEKEASSSSQDSKVFVFSVVVALVSEILTAKLPLNLANNWWYGTLEELLEVITWAQLEFMTNLYEYEPVNGVIAKAMWEVEQQQQPQVGFNTTPLQTEVAM